MGIKRKCTLGPRRYILIVILREKELYQVISENCPDAIKTGEIKNQFGRKVAIVNNNIYKARFTSIANIISRMRMLPN